MAEVEKFLRESKYLKWVVFNVFQKEDRKLYEALLRK